MVDEYEYKILSQYVEKQLSFTVLNALKGHFCVIYKDFGIFLFPNFVSFGPFKKCSSDIFCVIDGKKLTYQPASHQPNPKF